MQWAQWQRQQLLVMAVDATAEHRRLRHPCRLSRQKERGLLPGAPQWATS